MSRKPAGASPKSVPRRNGTKRGAPGTHSFPSIGQADSGYVRSGAGRGPPGIPGERGAIMIKNPFGNIGNIMKQAQAMQEQLAKIQEQAASKTVDGTAGGGMVTVSVSGAMQVVALKIDPEVLKSGDAEMLQDLIVAATNDALRKARDMMAEEMKSITGGLRIPGLF